MDFILERIKILFISHYLSFLAYSSLIKTIVKFFKRFFIIIVTYIYIYISTSLWKELWIDALESFLSDDSRGTFRLEATIYSLQLCLCESGSTTKTRQRVGPVSRRLFLLVLRVWKIERVFLLIIGRISYLPDRIGRFRDWLNIVWEILVSEIDITVAID